MVSHIMVWRVERWRGAGPYATKSEALGPMVRHHDESAAHPDPFDDGIYGIRRGTEYCGFLSREALDKWFKGYKQVLNSDGFNIAQYRVPVDRVRFGNKQLVFERGDLLPYAHFPIIRRGTVHQ